MMAGLAKTGFKPFFAVYSTFFQRCFDQAFQEAALQGLPVRLCLDRAGLVGGDGAVHHGFCDVALLRVLPGRPSQSYIWHKLLGTQATVGGSGSRMPQGDAPLTQPNMDVIRAWILEGARDN